MTGRHDLIMTEAERIKALGEASESLAPYPVNDATIGTWLDAMGYESARFRDGDEAPPSMAQVWTMPGLGRRRPPEDPLSRMTEFLSAQGYTAVLGTNCEQTYERYLRVGERPRVTSALDSVVGPKQTAMGEGYFVTSRNTWYVGADVVATMLFRVLKFIPKERAS
ncbi:MaoC family dehydratase N-terminal domain-containing protein [Nocardioides anomalus]|uniref:MaoC family dehydratase N-terminal domain-containing protein n=1 Tax=Nocardioides anomalus TaxID=2712223 RepID=UPI001E379B92|nr:MaoC family dehydratase N-terminal domain-containing protein [Nocardioides anomalus]